MKQGLLIAALVLASCAAPAATPIIIYVTPPPSNPEVRDTAEPGVSPSSTNVEPTTRTAPTTSFLTFEDGTYVVGVDIKAGTYRTREPSDGCYWERLSGFSGDDTIENDITDNVSIVAIAKSDEGFHTEGCGTWTSDLSRITTSLTSFGAGTYFVGVDVKPGRYRNSGGSSCYWERLRNFSGDGLIENDIVDSRTVVDIARTDKGFSSTNCGTWTRL